MYTRFRGGTHNNKGRGLAQLIRKLSLLLVSLVLFFGSLKARCASVTLAWNPSPSQGVTGYNICYGPSTHNYTNIVDVGNSTSFCLFGLTVGGTYCIAVTAYNNLGLESLPSDEVIYTVPDGAYGPKFENTSLSMNNGSFNFVLGADPGQQVIIQSSTDLVHWVSISTNTVSGVSLNLTDPNATNLIRAFRALLDTGGVVQPVGIALDISIPKIK